MHISTIGGIRAIGAIDVARAAGAITERDGTAPMEAIGASGAIGAIRYVGAIKPNEP